MKDDLINRKAAIDVLKGIDSYFVKYIEELPSAQPDKEMIHLLKEQAYMQGWEDGRKGLTERVVEVVRCKDCLHWKHGRIRINFCEIFEWANSAMDYCSFAEKRGDKK